MMDLSFDSFLFNLYESSEGLSPYFFYGRYKASPFEVSSFILKGSNDNLLRYDRASSKIVLTKEGRKEALQRYYRSVLSKRDRRIPIPKRFVGQAIGVQEVYSTQDINELVIKRRERTSIEEASRFRIRVKAD